MKLHGSLWILLSAVTAMLIEGVQAVPVANAVDNLDVESNLQARGFRKYISRKLGLSKGRERGESSTQHYPPNGSGQNTPARSSIASASSETASSDSSVSKSSSAEESGHETLLEDLTGRLWYQTGEGQHQLPPHFEEHYNDMHVAEEEPNNDLPGHQQSPDHFNHAAPQSPPVMSPQGSHSTSAAGSLTSSAASSAPGSPMHPSQGVEYMGNTFKHPQGGHHY